MNKVEQRRWERYFQYRKDGMPIDRAASKARLASSTAHRFERGDQSSTGVMAASQLGITDIAGVIVPEPYSEEATKALEDFAYFRLRYFGRWSTPWQERAAYEILRRLETKDREYAVINVPPGAGKSTLFTYDIPIWLACRNRSIRILIGSRTERQAKSYVGRIKRALMRQSPIQAKADDLEAGVACDATGVLAHDMGGFQPEGRSDKWTNEELFVRQLDGVSVDDKEATFAAYGADSGFLGHRSDYVIWDDLVDKTNFKTSIDNITAFREWWDTESEPRLEPGGLLVVQGQRMAPNDHYRYCLDMRTALGDRKYSHIIFKAHDDDRCTGHDADTVDKPWPEGCLLDPYRLPHREMETLRLEKPRIYAVQYQQEDGEGVSSLVQKEWIKGGTDSDGVPCPGCLDTDRSVGEVPEQLTRGEFYSFITVDPSPDNYWGIGWWVYDPASQLRFLIDIWRRRMDPHHFLTVDYNTGEFSGLVPTVRARSFGARVPIKDITVETNAAQKWLLDQPYVKEYIKQTGIAFKPHTTTIRKQDPAYGFESIGELFRQGKIRLPYGNATSRMKVNDLLSEAYNYPDADTDDLLMMVWFAKLAVEKYIPLARTTPSSTGTDRYAKRGLYGWGAA